ncbi:hypothetical protein MSKU9_1655 [Komagataeibacter diospyri]|uniref:Uncharacterized protein n=1 Tax=Komagataeibacter diospyri TaxID=1932662 RepID=A0A4P5NTL2_9PROT|nr:hypothetical protein [Komagataeibacter diospyri]GCE83514.1 hypothetical protein MSKU9_1655 [Komagataeibacter diospyri]
MARRKKSMIPDDVLDQVLAGRVVRTMSDALGTVRNFVFRRLIAKGEAALPEVSSLWCMDHLFDRQV